MTSLFLKHLISLISKDICTFLCLHILNDTQSILIQLKPQQTLQTIWKKQIEVNALEMVDTQIINYAHKLT